MAYQIIKIDHDEGLHRVHSVRCDDLHVANIMLRQMEPLIQHAYPGGHVTWGGSPDDVGSWIVTIGTDDQHQVIAEYHVVEVAPDDKNFV